MLRDMKTQAHLKPGQKGTKRLVEQYGDALLCVRYRFDQVRGVKLKTVDLVVGEIPFRTGSGYCDDERWTEIGVLTLEDGKKEFMVLSP